MSRDIYSAAVDLGATSGRVVLGHWDGTKLTLREVHRFPNAIQSLNGRDYWEIGRLWREVQSGLQAARAALPTGASLASVGVDTWGADHVLVDNAGQIIFPVHSYRDSRTQPHLAQLEGNTAAQHTLYAATGIPPIFYNTSLQLAETVTTNPELRRLAQRCLLLPDYFNFLLSGRMENEVSIASTTQLLDIATPPRWSDLALDHFGIPQHWFRGPILSGMNLGVCEGAQVIAVPGHDTACAFDGMPSAGSGRDLYLSSGTWSLVGFESDTPLLGGDALAAKISNERTGDGKFRPLKSVVGLWILEGLLRDFEVRPASPPEWERLLASAQSEPSPSLLLDLSDPAFVNPPSMRQAIDAQLSSRGARMPPRLAGYVRLACESLGESHARALRQFQTLSGRTFDRILIVGGGAKNRLLCEATANAAGIPVVACDVEGTAIGNLARQYVALGAAENVSALKKILSQQISSRTFLPRTRT